MVSNRVLDSEDEATIPRKRSDPSNDLDDADDDSKRQKKKAKTAGESDESEAEANSQVSPIW